MTLSSSIENSNSTSDLFASTSLSPRPSNHNSLSFSAGSIISTDLTPVELWIQLVVFYGMLGGLMSMMGNIAIAIGILRNKKLRTRFFVILWFLVVTRAVLNFGYFSVFIHRSLRTLGVVNVEIKRIYCLLIHFHFVYIQTIEMVHLLVLVIDKILAIAAFRYYRNLTLTQAIITCVLSTSGTLIIKIIPSLFDVNFNEVIPCLSGFDAASDQYDTYTTNLELSLALLILLLYIWLILYVYYRRARLVKAVENRNQHRNNDQQGDQSKLIALKRQSRLLPLLQRMVLMHCGTTLLLKTFGSILMNYVPDELFYRIAGYFGVLVTVQLFLNVIILLISNKQLREASFPCFFSRNSVNPSISQFSGQARESRA